MSSARAFEIMVVNAASVQTAKSNENNRKSKQDIENSNGKQYKKYDNNIKHMIFKKTIRE